MKTHTASISGPLTDDDLRMLCDLLRMIEANNPAGLFRIYIDDPESDRSVAEMQRKVEEMNPQPAGYERRWFHGKRKK